MVKCTLEGDLYKFSTDTNGNVSTELRKYNTPN